MTRPVCDTRKVFGYLSLFGGGPLTKDIAISLVNDEKTPGASKYYGTNASGVKGWHSLQGAIPDTASLIALINALEVRIELLESQVPAVPVAIITAVNYTITSDSDVLVTATAAGITITLPLASVTTNEGREISVKNLSAGDITVAAPENIDTALSWTLAPTEAMTVKSNGSIWNVV